MTKHRFIIILFFFCLTFLTRCKKYPENLLWFKSPQKLDPFNGNLTKYTVNGIDSLDLLSYYYAKKYPKDLRQLRFSTQHRFTDHFGTTLSYYYASLDEPITYSFVKKNKFMKITRYPDTSLFKKSLFISSDIEWQIIRLAKKGPFRIKTTLENGNTYEIEITP